MYIITKATKSIHILLYSKPVIPKVWSADHQWSVTVLQVVRGKAK